MIDELKKLRELTETLTGNGYLKDQAEEWEYALDAIPDYIYIVNTKFEVKFINRILANRLKVKKTDVYGKPCYKVILNSESEEPLSEWQNLDACNGCQTIEEKYLSNLNGWFNMSRSPIYTKTSKLLGFICILQDVTERRETRSKVKALLSKLKCSEQKYKLIVENVVDAVWTIDTKLNFTFINPAIKDLMGYEPEEWIGHNIAEFAYEEDFEYMAYQVGNALADPNFNNVVFETKMLNKIGDAVPIEINAKSLRDEKGNLLGFQGITRIKG
jgi:PAS domain S-box-containing protein